MARRRAQWLRCRYRINPARLVFIDETWTKTNLTPLRGWAPRGKRLKAKVPHRRWCFRLYVEQMLLPTLHPGDVVVLDNLGSHKSKAIRRVIRSVGAKLLFLPKYSPDFNPIEQFFAKLKHWLRKAAKRTVDPVCNAIVRTLDTVTSDELQEPFRSCRV